MKTLSKLQFRLGITLAVVLSAASVLLDLFGKSWLPDLLREWADHEMDGETTPDEMLVVMLGFPYLGICLIHVIALYCMVWWSRPLLLVIWAGGYALELLSGPTVSLAPTMVLMDASTLLWGGLLGVMYFSPDVSAWFERRKEPLPPPLRSPQ